MTETTQKKSIKTIARAGLIAKGVVYVLIGIIAFMAAFGLGRHNSDDVSSKSAFLSIENLPAGGLLLWVLALGLLCYTTWRWVQVFRKPEGMEKEAARRLRYFFSGLTYLALTFTVIRFALKKSSSGDDENQQLAGELMDKPFGPWLVIIAGLIMAGVGIYQAWYGLSEKYRKHIQTFSQGNPGASLLLRSGKVGYVARGIVWLVVSYMLIRAGWDHNSSEAGSTGKAFQLLESSTGSFIPGIVGLGLVAYGIFCFIRARYDRFA